MMLMVTSLFQTRKKKTFPPWLQSTLLLLLVLLLLQQPPVSQTPPGAAASLLLSSGLHHKAEANPWRITSVQLQNHVGIKALTRLPNLQTRNSLNQQQKVQCNRKELCATDDDQAQGGGEKKAWSNLKKKNPWIPNLLSPQSLLQIAIKKLPLSLSLSLSTHR
jgi:hypothetical protein